MKPYPTNPTYWQYKGKPVLLLGGTWQDNLFNHPIALERHLDLLRSVGGNYARHVMSHRNVAEMRRSGNITTPDHRHMIDHPDLYSFLDISQNNTQGGQTHWDRMLQVRAMVQERPRPINNNKIYSGGNDEEAVARLFRIIFTGGASARFHRPHPLEGTGDHEKSTQWGLGLSPRAQATLRDSRTTVANSFKLSD
jgi:hypothetical protein